MVGIGTTTVTPGFKEWKDDLPKEPTGDVKKRYVVSCISPSDWTDIHTLLLKDGTLDDNIPSDIVECSDNKLHSGTRGTYKLTESEASDLRKHPKVRCVDIDAAYYAGTYAIDPALMMDSAVQTERYATTVKNLRGSQNISSFLPTTPTSADKNRAGYQLLRCKQKDNAWGNNVTQIINDKLASYGDGSDVDCIVADQAMWFGHIEFQNNLGGPVEYNAQNVLVKKGISSTSGTCDVLDLVLDAPYYIDPDYFNANPGARLTTRWDGTTVPLESVAIGWWMDASKRSAEFASAGTTGTISSYSRARCNGDNTANHSAGSTQYHGTPCASQVYGRQYGFAYNANKWFINSYGWYGTGMEIYFDIVKIFHQTKPVNASYGTKDPTITSNSMGYRKDLPISANYYYRVGLSGHIEVSYSADVTTSDYTYTSYLGASNEPRWSEQTAANSYSESISYATASTTGPGGASLNNIFDNDASTFVNMGSGHADISYLWLTHAMLTDVVKITIGYDGHGWVGYNGVGQDSANCIRVDNGQAYGANGVTGSPTEIILYDGTSTNTPIYSGQLTNLNFIEYPNVNGTGGSNRGAGSRCHVYYIKVQRSTDNVLTEITYSSTLSYELSGTDKAGSISGFNPTITMNSYDTITFNVNSPGHPFWIKNQAGTGIGNAASNVTNNGTDNGTVTFKPVVGATYYYQCELHSSMVGSINVGNSVAAGVSYDSTSTPAFMDNFSQGAIRFEYADNALTIAGDEMIDAGVIFVCSSGNTNQKLVKYDHPDYNNYYSTVSPDSGYDVNWSTYAGYQAYNSINRQGFPGQIGKQVDAISGITTYRTIPVGAMDPALQSTSGTGQERKVFYSNMGNLVPYYAPAADTLAATDANNSPRYNRYDAYYTLNSTQSLESEDCSFGGTSSACPVSCGVIATKLQYNRGWTVEDVLNWVTVGVGTQSESAFYNGPEASSANSSDWADNKSIQGGNPIVIWDAPTGNEDIDGDDKIAVRLKNASGLKMTGINFINT